MLQRFEFIKVCMGKTLKSILDEIWLFLRRGNTKNDNSLKDSREDNKASR